MTPKDVIKFMKDQKAVAIDMKFNDFLGIWQHFTIPVSEMSEDIFEEGSGFDGSSIRGWQPINASDMLVMPDPSTATMDPFCQEPTLSLIYGTIADGVTASTIILAMSLGLIVPKMIVDYLGIRHRL